MAACPNPLSLVNAFMCLYLHTSTATYHLSPTLLLSCHHLHPRCPNLTYLDLSDTDKGNWVDAEEDITTLYEASKASRFAVLGEVESACRHMLTYLDLSDNRLSRNVLRSFGQVPGLVIDYYTVDDLILIPTLP